MRAGSRRSTPRTARCLALSTSIPGPGEPGHETWADDHNAYLTGGGGVWTHAVLRCRTATAVIFGTGESQPWADPAFRPGDNLYTNSTVALDADTGELKWYFQEIPQETWDYDTDQPQDAVRPRTTTAKTHKVVGTFSRNGFFYTLDRTNGSSSDGHGLSRPELDRRTRSQTGKPVEYIPGSPTQEYAPKAALKVGDANTAQQICPALQTSTWWPPTYSPDTKVVYMQAIDTCFSQSMDAHIDPTRTDLRAMPACGAVVTSGSSTTPSRTPRA